MVLGLTFRLVVWGHFFGWRPNWDIVFLVLGDGRTKENYHAFFGGGGEEVEVFSLPQRSFVLHPVVHFVECRGEWAKAEIVEKGVTYFGWSPGTTSWTLGLLDTWSWLVDSNPLKTQYLGKATVFNYKTIKSKPGWHQVAGACFCLLQPSTPSERKSRPPASPRPPPNKKRGLGVSGEDQEPYGVNFFGEASSAWVSEAQPGPRYGSQGVVQEVQLKRCLAVCDVAQSDGSFLGGPWFVFGWWIITSCPEEVAALEHPRAKRQTRLPYFLKDSLWTVILSKQLEQGICKDD